MREIKQIHEKLLEKSVLYAKWHQYPGHKFYHWLVFVLIAGFTAAALFTKINIEFSASLGQTVESQTQTEKMQAAEVKTLTTQLLQAIKQYRLAVTEQDKTASLSNLTMIALQRREAMSAEAKNSPQNFLLNSLPPAFSREVPTEIVSLVEKEIEVKGELAVLIFDNFDNKRSQTEYRLETADSSGSKKIYRLHFAKGQPDLLSGSTIKVKGVALDSELALTEAGGTSLQTISAAAATTTGDQRTLAILFNFTNNTNQPFTTGYVADVLFYASGHNEDTGSVNTYYQDTAFNQISFSGDVFGWYTIPYDNSNCGGMYTTWANAAEQAARNAGVNVDGYPRRVYVFPIQPLNSCSWAGWATYNGSPSKAWIVAENVTTHKYGVELLTHELGHNLGARHASSIDCGAKQIDIYSNCTVSEYGDTSDTMGSWNPGHFNGPHKIGETWFGGSQVQTATESGAYNVSLLEQGDAAVKVLKIGKPDTGEAYYLSYRQPLNFDSGISSGYHRGASVHIWNGAISNQTKLIDTTPETSTVTDSPLGDGLSFEDPINGIIITQLSHDSSRATLSVSFGPAVCTKANPTVSVSPLSQTGSAGQTLNYTVSVKNNDTSACANTAFNLTGMVLTGWTSSFSPASLTLVPGVSGQATWAVTSKAGEIDGSYTITAKATDSLAATHANSANATYQVYTPVPDTTPPTVAIISPVNGATIGSSVTIKVSATDNVGVAKVEIYIDGTLKVTDTTSPYTYKWNTRKVATGSHTITAKAYDAAGNTASTIVSVYK
mgnify:FL=1